MPHPKRLLRLASALAACSFVFTLILPFAAQAEPLIAAHTISARLEPTTHRLSATDRLDLEGVSSGSTLSLLLHKDLEVRSVKAEPSGAALTYASRPGPDHRQVVEVALGGTFSAPRALAISYEGTVYNPIEKAETLAFVRGDETTGLIDPQGVFLAPSTGWYPDTADEGLARFELEVSLPERFLAVSQGRLAERRQEAGRSVSRWSSRVAADGLYLVAGPYRVNSRREGPVVISTYFLSGSDDLAAKYLEAAAGYIALYGELLGPYPYDKFDIVENFFSSGYGMPSFTLLGPGVIAQGERALRPGYLDHEVLHSWWGNYVFHPPGPGNWAEALTTYCANYYWQELKEGPEAARAWRRRTVQKYAIRVKPANAYPLEAFAGKERDFENDIGYGKGAMVFHMLRRQVGDDSFWAALREAVKRFGGRHASWADFRRLFEASSGQDLSWFFDQWLARPAGPALALRDVSVKPSPQGGFRVEGSLVQEGTPYRLAVPIRLEAGRALQEETVELSASSVAFAFETASLPRALEVDPDGHLFRQLSPAEVSPGLNALLEDAPALVVAPEEGQDPNWRVYRELAERAAAQKGATVLTPAQVTEEHLRSGSVLVLGRARALARLKPLVESLPPWVGLEEGSIHVKEETFSDPTDSALVVARNHLNPDHFVGFYFGLTEKALERARLVYFYGWDGYVVFRSGRPVARGDVEPLHTPGRSSLALTLSRPIARGALMEHVRTLADPSLRGRSPGTAGDGRAARYIQETLERAGFEPVTDVGKSPAWMQSITLTLPDIGFFNLRLSRGEETLEPASWPVIGSPEGRYEAAVVEAGYGLVSAGRDDYRGRAVNGKAVLVRDGLPEGVPAPEGGALQALEMKVEEAAGRGAAALLVAVEGPLPEDYLAMTAYPSIPSPALKAHVGKLKARGQFALLPAEIMKLQSRSETMEAPAVPVILMPGAEEWLGKLEGSGESPFTLQLSLHYRRGRWKTQNVIGYMVGSDPVLRRDIVILGAHYDALGPSATGQIFLGADDNASGVAALLEAARLLARQRAWLKRSLLVVAFGAEEWGLVGSRYYIEHPVRDLARTVALLNADSIAGRTPAAQAYLIGRSYHPELAAAAEAYAGEVGLAVGRDIDQHAFRLGSDHWPFHKAGVPVLDFWASNYRRMNTAEDTIENLDEDKLERMARLFYLTALDLLTAPEATPHAPAKSP